MPPPSDAPGYESKLLTFLTKPCMYTQRVNQIKIDLTVLYSLNITSDKIVVYFCITGGLPLVYPVAFSPQCRHHPASVQGEVLRCLVISSAIAKRLQLRCKRPPPRQQPLSSPRQDRAVPPDLYPDYHNTRLEAQGLVTYPVAMKVHGLCDLGLVPVVRH